MLLTILLNILNIVLNLFFVLGLSMNVDGVALGSLISSYVTLAVGFIFLRSEFRTYLKLLGRAILLQKEAFIRLFQVNRDIFIRTICLIFTFTFFTAVSSSFGDEKLAINTILLQFWFIASYGIDGFAYAAESLVGRFKGSGNRESLIGAVKGTMIWGLSLGVAGSLIYLVLHEQMLHIFTDKQAVIQGAREVIGWTILAPLLSSVCYIWDGVYIGATATAPMRNSMIIATCLVFFPVYVVTEPYLGFEALWLALLMFMLSRGLMLSIFANRSIFKATVNKN
jgi:MATE family multidrug resistance protein